MLGTRLLVTLVALPPLVAIVYVGGLPLIALAVLAALLSAHELLALLSAGRLSVFAMPLGGGAVFLTAVGAWPELGLARFAVPLVLLAVSFWALRAVRLDAGSGDRSVALRDSTLGWALTIAGAFYIGLPFGAALALRAAPGPDVTLGPLPLPFGAAWLALALAITFIGDSVAYFVGRYLGRRHFSPVISPKKTIEGLAGALAAATFVGALGGPFVGLTPVVGALLGIVGGAAGAAGDLMESLLKRTAGVKDSGAIFPGHGGMLDRIDSMLFVVLVVYFAQQLTPLAP